MITIKRITEAEKADVRLKNEAFPIWGRLIPRYDGEKWTYTEQRFPKEQCSELCFPEGGYDFDEMKDESFFAGAYDEGKCVGLAVYRKDWFRYLYLDDLKVNSAFRGHGIGGLLLEEGMKLAAELGLRGVYTIAQDNNLSACRFYLKHGFEIGGLNTRVYDGTKQEGKRDVYFYKEL